MLKLSNLQEIDFAKLYRQQQERSSFVPKLVEHWDRKASKMNDRAFEGVYAKDFISKIDLGDAKTILDVGCGPGTLGISLAEKLEKVYCLDFSPKMLEFAKQNAKNKGLNNVSFIQKSFYDDWSEVPKCDILIASRCMMVSDARAILELFNSKAKRVYLSYKTYGSLIDDEIYKLLDREFEQKPSYMHYVNILYQMGIYAKVDFIRSENNRFANLNLEDFLERIDKDIGELGSNEHKKLAKFHAEVYSKQKQEDFIHWTLISYDVKDKK